MDDVGDGGNPEGRHYPPRCFGEIFQPCGSEQSKVPVDRFVNPVDIVFAEGGYLPQHWFVPVYEVLHAVVSILRDYSIGSVRMFLCAVEAIFEPVIGVTVRRSGDVVLILITDLVFLHEVFGGRRMAGSLFKSFLHVLPVEPFEGVDPTGVLMGKIAQIVQ